MPNSSVTLPCELPVHRLDPGAGGGTVKVAWNQSARGVLLEIDTSDSVRFHFRDPREGRVKVFPNSCAVGNFSIRIDRLRHSDLGEYCCSGPNGSVCSVLGFRISHAGVQNAVVHFMGDNWYFICAGGGLVLLLVTCVCYAKYRKRDDYDPDYVNTSFHKRLSTSQSSSNGGGAEEVVYENDDQVPNSVACVESKPEPEATSMSTRQQLKLFHANQEELCKRLQTREERQKKQKFQYNNPIYSNSIEQLGQV